MSAAAPPRTPGTSPGAVGPEVVVDAQNPWPGLEAFREQDESFFKGRDAEIEVLLRRVRQDRVTILRGPSGLGKSSLLQAGLFPRLRTEFFLPVYIRISYDEAAPPLRDQVLTALATEAAAHGVDAPQFDTHESLWEHFHRQEAGYWSPDNRPVVPVLVFDQFEEAFTLGSDPAAAARTAAFLEELGDLIEGRPSAALKVEIDADRVDPRRFAYDRNEYRVLIGIREDFLGYIDTLQSRVSSLDVNHRMKLTPLSGQAATVVTAAGGDELVPPAVGELIVRLVSGETRGDSHVPLDQLVVDPALLSLFCRELNERRKAGGRRALTVDMVEVSRDQILKDFYERSVADLSPAVRIFIEDRLLTVDGYRNSEAIVNALATPGITQSAIDTLVQRRLIRREERDGRTRLELTHDVLTPVVRASRDERRGQEASAAAEADARRAAEQTKARLRATHRIMAALLVAAGVTAVFGWYALKDARASKESLSIAELSQAYMAADRFDPSDALAHTASALRLGSSVAARALAFRLLTGEWWPTMYLDVGGRRSVTDAAFSPDGAQVATGYRDGETILWSIAGREPAMRLHLQRHSPVASVEFSPDGAQIVTASWDGVVRVWDARSGALMDSLTHGKGLNFASFSPDGQTVISASDDSTARLWRPRSGQTPVILHEDNRVLAARVGRTGQYALTVVDTAAAGYVLHVWDMSGSPAITASGRVKSDPTQFKFGPEGTSILVPGVGEAPLGGMTAEHRASAAAAKAAFDSASMQTTVSTDVSGDGTRIMRADRDGNVMIVDRRDGSLVSKFYVQEDLLSDAQLSPDGRFVVTISTQNLVRLWRVADSSATQIGPAFRAGSNSTSVLFSANGAALLTLADGVPSVRQVEGARFSADSLPGGEVPRFIARDTLLTVMSDTGVYSLQLWSVRGGAHAPIRAPVRLERTPASVDVAADGSKVAVLDTAGTINFWNPRTGGRVGPSIQATTRLPNGRDLMPISVRISADGARVLAVLADTLQQEGRARVWDARSGQQLGRELRHSDMIEMASFSPDGQTVLTASDDSTAQLWDASTGAARGPPLRHLGFLESARFSHDGNLVATASNDATARIWNAHTFAQITAPLLHRRIVTDAEFSDDGSRVVTSSWDGTAQVWQTATGTPVGRPLQSDVGGHTTNLRILKAHFAPGENDRVITVDANGRAQMWDAQNGAPIGAPFEHEQLYDAVLSPDGQVMVTSGSAMVRIWDVRTGSPSDGNELADLVEAVGGTAVGEHGGDRRLTSDEIASRMRHFRALAAAPGAAPPGSFLEFLRWYFGVAPVGSSPSERTR